eukprot:13832613-Alexandrium_andersonii.AAC.1
MAWHSLVRDLILLRGLQLHVVTESSSANDSLSARGPNLLRLVLRSSSETILARRALSPMLATKGAGMMIVKGSRGYLCVCASARLR